MMLRISDRLSDTMNVRRGWPRVRFWVSVPIANKVQSASMQCVNFFLFAPTIRHIPETRPTIGYPGSRCAFDSNLSIAKASK